VVALPLAVVVGETPPQADCEHDTVQVTPLLAESLATVAVKFAVWPGSTLCGADGETLTEIGGGGGGGGAIAVPQPELLTAITSAISIAMIDAKFFDFMTASSRPHPVLSQQNGERSFLARLLALTSHYNLEVVNHAQILSLPPGCIEQRASSHWT